MPEDVAREALILERAAGRALVRPEQLVLPKRRLAPVRVVRPGDLLHVTFHFTNLELVTSGRRRVLVKGDDRGPGLLAVEHPSQHITEFARYEDAKGIPAKEPGDEDTHQGQPEQTPPVRSLIAGPSRVVYEVPAGTEIPYTVEGLLDACRTLPLRVGANARERRKSTPPPWWDDDIHIADALFRRPRLRVDRNRVAADAVAATRLLRSSALLAERLGPEVAGHAAVATGRAGLLGDVRKELLPGAAEVLRPRIRPRPADPGDGLTGIELPWRLILSPHGGAAWAHSLGEVEHEGRVELWHTRLGLRITRNDVPDVDERTTEGRTLRAVWTRDREWWSEEDHPMPELPAADGSQDEPSFRMALNANDRLNIVHLTSDWSQTLRGKPWEPDPVDARRLMLTSLGGWLDVSGEWEGPLPVAEWKHRASMGRDSLVRVVRHGFLFPFGHRASLVKVTERKIADGVAYLFQRMFIVVKERTRTYGAEPLTYDGPVNAGRAGERLDTQLPFSSITIETRLTPNLDEPEDFAPAGTEGSGYVFFPHVLDRPFAFKAVGVDHDGRPIELNTPLLFVELLRNTEPAIRKIAGAYDKVDDARTTAAVGGQRVAMAPSENPDDTAVAVHTINWGGDPHKSLFVHDDPYVVGFVPRIRHAQAVIPAAAALAGNAAPAKVQYPAKYKSGGFDGNAGQVFLELPDKLGMDFASQSDRSGGLVAPGLEVSGLSRITGPVSGKLDTFADGQFKPIEFLKTAVPAKLFGVIDLWELVEETGVVPNDLRIPQFVTQVLDEIGALLDRVERLRAQLAGLGAEAELVRTRGKALVDAITAVLDPSATDPTDLETRAGDLADAIDGLLTVLPGISMEAGARRALDSLLRTVHQALATWAQLQAVLDQLKQGFQVPEVVTARLEWRPELKDWALGIADPTPDQAIFRLHRNGSAVTGGLVVAVAVEVPTTGATPRIDVTCSLSEFDLQLIGADRFLVVDFEAISFIARAGKKPEVDVKLREVRFEGALSFVETLRSLIPLDGFSDPPSLDVTPAGITSSFSLALPNIAVGIFSLENLSFAAHLNVPFVGGSLETSFSFCTREDPFRLTVSLFAGGGFLGITLTPAGIKRLEAAFEFGAAVALDFGVASGSLSVMAGIYFKMELEDGREDCTLSGYFRARGEVDVLGIISASIELYLELTYEVPTEKATGRATITIEIEVLFFSGSVEVSCEKKFAGSNGDPTFEESMALGPPGQRPWDAFCRAFAEVA